MCRYRKVCTKPCQECPNRFMYWTWDPNSPFGFLHFADKETIKRSNAYLNKYFLILKDKYDTLKKSRDGKDNLCS